MRANVKIAVAEHLNPRCAACGSIFEQNLSTLATTGPAVCNQSCGIGDRGLLEDRLATACAADRASVVGKAAVTSG